jgi:predicted PurR-regulated permease PerM
VTAPRPPVASSPASPPAPGESSLFPWLLGAAAIVLVAYLFRDLILPLVLAVLLAYLLNPLVAWAQGLGIRRSVAVVGVFGSLALVLVLTGWLAGPRVRAEGVALVAHLPPLLERGIRRAADEIRDAYPRLARIVPAVPDEEGWLEAAVQERLGHASAVAEHAGSLLLVGILTPFFAFFLLRDGGRMLRFVLDGIHPQHMETSLAVWSEIDHIIGRYLRGIALDGLAVGSLAAIGLWLIEIPYPLLLGAFTAFVNPIPYLCTVLGVLAASVVALANGLGLGAVVSVLVFYLALRILDDVLIAPLLVGGSVHLHPILVLASIIAGERTLGLVGMVVGIPLVTVAKETLRLLVEHRRTLRRQPGPARPRTDSRPHYVC